MFIRLIFESFNFAWQALRENVLRTMLSLLGVTVGIFAIIAVLTVVDSMEKNIKQTLSFLGDHVIYVSKMPFIFTPSTPWWKYFNRPPVKYNEFKFLEKAIVNQKGAAIYDQKGNLTLKNKNNSISGCFLQGVSYQYNTVSDVPIENGRYFTQQESESGKNIAIVGSQVSEALFPSQDPIGKTLKINGLNFVVIATLKKQGASLLGADFDNVAYIPYSTFSKSFGSRWSEPDIMIKGLDSDEGLMELESEVIQAMRSRRSLKPIEEDNFSINRPEMIAGAVESIFGILHAAGWFIGTFSILVGGFGIANIMFVSVRERTNIIGIQKSLGAKNYFILFQFLFEALFLSFLGGFVGLFLVYLITFIPLGSFELSLSMGNIILGLSICTIVGLLAGIIPAAIAARMDPVIAIRSK